MQGRKTREANHNKIRQAQSGNTLIEYAIIGCCIVVVAIAGLLVSGGHLDSLLALLKSDVANQALLANAANAKQMAAKSAFQTASVSQTITSTNSASNVPISSAGMITVTMPDGTRLNMAAPVDLPHSIVTLGANGTTELLATSLEALAKQLLAAGKISPSGSNAIMNLANLAHRQAAIASVVETAMKNSGSNTQAALASTVQFEGQSYKLSDLAGMISTGSANSSGSYNYGSESAKFWGAYSNLWPAGAMQNSTASGIIDVYVHEIANLSDSNRVILYKMGTGYGGTPAEYQQSEASYMASIGYSNTAILLQTKTGAAVTNQNAASICTTGGSKDASGVLCTH